MNQPFDPVTPARLAWREGIPFAPAFGDRYFSTSGALAESRTVFIDGNHLSRRFDALPPATMFVIGENGFGTGLNLLLAARHFLTLAPATSHLSMISAELHPLTSRDLARALDAWPELQPLTGRLLAAYPPAAPGFHRIRLAPNVTLDLMFGDAQAMWARQTAEVDAWFLDGFAPDRNPALWGPDLMRILARRSRPGATLASFSVARTVRDALSQAGFAIRRETGFGRKRQRLEGDWTGDWRPRPVRRGRVLIAGAGMAGATTARALAERGWQVAVHDPGGVAGAASGNRLGVLYTTPSGAITPQNRFYQQSYLHALGWMREQAIESAALGRLDGVVQHIVTDRQRRKLNRAREQGVWPEALLRWLDDDTVLLPAGGVVRPAEWCRALLEHGSIAFRRAAVDPDTDPEFDALILATAAAVEPLTGLDFGLRSIRGQVTECRATASSRRWTRAHCHEGYLTPALDGIHCLGASFNLGSSTLEARTRDDRNNLEQLQRRLPEHWRKLGGAGIKIVGHRVGFRCQTRDYLPLAGPVPGRANESPIPCFINAAYGSRGLSGTPLVADLIADRLSGLPVPVDAELARALDPLRALRVAHPRAPG